MNAVKTRGDSFVQLGRLPRQDAERCNISENLVRHHWLRLGSRRLGADDIRRSRAEDWSVSLGRLNKTARDVGVIRRSREFITAHAVRKHRGAPARAADDLGSIHWRATQGVVHHFRQLRCSECADDCATRDEKRGHNAMTITLVSEQMQFPERSARRKSVFHADEAQYFLISGIERNMG